jgi:transmembrane sensor
LFRPYRKEHVAMDDFLRYFENEKFIHWIYNPDPEINEFWDDWFRNHPEEKKEAEFARLILLQLRSREDKVESEEIKALYSGIAGKLVNSKPGNKTLRFFVPLMRYAAVALILLSLGVLVKNYLSQNKHDNREQFITVAQGNSSDAQLILADGRKIDLNSKESSVEYSAKGNIVINQKDTIDGRSQSMKSGMNQLIIPYGKNSSIRLPDGTMAYLNAGSKLMYPTVSDGKTREVILSGEGYFEVAHNPEQPFVVKINDLRVVALGTIFNISAYSDDKIIETVLVQGRVVLRDKSSSLFKKDFVLKPNDLATFDRQTLATTSRQVDAEQYVTWHKGVLNFQSAELKDIIIKVERYYNIKVLLENPKLGTRSITGKLMLKEDKERVLEVLATTAHLELNKINDNNFRLK